MARNRDKEYLRKLAAIEVNGFKVDIANYVYNPSYEHEYPTLRKQTGETDKERIISEIGYFKNYKGDGEYTIKTYAENKADESAWQVIKPIAKTVVSTSRRFSMNELIKLAENF